MEEHGPLKLMDYAEKGIQIVMDFLCRSFVNIISLFIITNVAFKLIRLTQSGIRSEPQTKLDCKIEFKRVRLEVADDDEELLLLPAMEGNGLENVFSELGGAWGVRKNGGRKTILSTRANQLPD